MEENAYVNTQTAQLRNVIALLTGVERAENRPQHLPGLVCFYGPSGWGKSYAAAYVANTKNAYYVELKSTWTVKYLLQAICKEMGLTYSTGDTLAALGEMPPRAKRRSCRRNKARSRRSTPCGANCKRRARCSPPTKPRWTRFAKSTRAWTRPNGSCPLSKSKSSKS